MELGRGWHSGSETMSLSQSLSPQQTSLNGGESESKSISESLSYIGGGRVLLRDAHRAARLLDLVADLAADVVVFLVVDLTVDLLVDLLVDCLVDLVVDLQFTLRVILPQGTPLAVF